ncbi:ribonuclease T2 family protein [Nitrosophilus kaiyonis]|uniref:ribonuclease T2 family protein n=1 Tax=Nitrosophilus kaiyonis TaxID=2930200 RepID=UPI002490F789|nr:hypothetical protein [Nitrosophilus kaiyonis]
MKKLLVSLLLTIAALANEYILAIQWFPSVCKVKNYKECKIDYPFWRENFTLHGLWPKKTYCKVSPRDKILDKKGDWKNISTKISPSLAQVLVMYMPGYLSGLHKHEWIKHGSCMSKTAEEYYLNSINLISQLNNSKIKDFFLKNRGKRVQTIKIRNLFKKEFGNGKNIKFICKKGYLTELRIKLEGKITPITPLFDLIYKAKPISIGCKIGKIAR